MKILVIGGSGFLGSHVADELSERGHEVTIFDSIKSTFINFKQKMVVGDITNIELLNSIIGEHQIVYHFAGIAGIKDASDNPVETVKNNILGTTFICY